MDRQLNYYMLVAPCFWKKSESQFTLSSFGEYRGIKWVCRSNEDYNEDKMYLVYICKRFCVTDHLKVVADTCS